MRTVFLAWVLGCLGCLPDNASDTQAIDGGNRNPEAGPSAPAGGSIDAGGSLSENQTADGGGQPVTGPTTQCNDTIDNDDNGLTDFPDDP